MTYFSEEAYAHVNNAMDKATELLNCAMKLIDAAVGIVAELAALKGQAYVVELPKPKAEDVLVD